MVSGSPVENKAEMKEARSEERNWMARSRMIGRSKRPMGLNSSEMASVMASPSPIRMEAAMTRTTTASSRMP
ncbi:hypothetical protein RJ641_004266 [Dillenia turbinata]|uniref:Uncharacterized protein n=1 Tax=Dillenia turbinata TaxID=194707 RepID=A0AAN8VIR2_9MAGN